ncbi:hypothetical protein BDZ89DRAFT_1047123 [Hymenopellis radicata]|nr:hypothetical protein BDZ89DRAFT_1047123 [Hymenopellis radicata]
MKADNGAPTIVRKTGVWKSCAFKRGDEHGVELLAVDRISTHQHDQRAAGVKWAAKKSALTGEAVGGKVFASECERWERWTQVSHHMNPNTVAIASPPVDSRYEDWRKQLDLERAARMQAEQLLQARLLETEAMDAILGWSTSISTQCISTMVSSLNSEIDQLASLILDSLPLSSSQISSPSASSLPNTPPLLWNYLLVQINSTSDHDIRHALRDIAIRSVLAGLCHDLIRAWSTRPKLSSVLQDLEHRIRLTSTLLFTLDSEGVSHRYLGPVIVVAHWRALTRSNLKYREPGAFDSFAKRVIFNDLTASLSMLGFLHPNDTGENNLKHSVYADRVAHLAESMIKLDRAMHEECREYPLALLFKRPGQPFDPAAMTEVQFDGPIANGRKRADTSLESPTEEKVACACGLGLVDNSQGLIILKPEDRAFKGLQCNEDPLDKVPTRWRPQVGLRVLPAEAMLLALIIVSNTQHTQ